MSAYYNEIDPFAAAWLRELVKAGEIAPGDVDERSIEDVVPDDLAGYDQCHFFAGVGGWSRALRLAGWPDDRPVWTGSCPCQPFSAAGKRAGFADERHLWPAWHWLIQQRRPDRILGEQVAGGDGDAWLDLVLTDLEALGYTCGPVDFPAAGAGAPIIRQRLWFVARADGSGLPLRSGAPGPGERGGPATESRGDAGGVEFTAGGGTRAAQQRGRRDGLESPGPVNGFWAGCEWVWCRPERDGKPWTLRPVEPGTFPLADGVPARVGRLRGYGNAINAEAAACVVRAAIDCGALR